MCPEHRQQLSEAWAAAITSFEASISDIEEINRHEVANDLVDARIANGIRRLLRLAVAHFMHISRRR